MRGLSAPLFRKPLAWAAALVAVMATACASPHAPQTSLPPRPAEGPAAAYYSATKGKSGPELKAALHEIISKHEQLSYSEVWDALKETDAAPGQDGKVVLLYTGDTRSAGASGGKPGNWNREHVWAKSHGGFGTAKGPGTDLHHLRPTDVQVNSTRSNKDFDEGGEEVQRAPGNFTDADSFEPRDAVKGDVARMLFYMAVRYEPGDVVDLEINDKVGNGSAPHIGRLSVLKRWHEQDPPDVFEQRRNEAIFARQGNRNPFIDHPEWAASVWR